MEGVGLLFASSKVSENVNLLKKLLMADKRLGLSFQFYFQTLIQHDFCSI